MTDQLNGTIVDILEAYHRQATEIETRKQREALLENELSSQRTMADNLRARKTEAEGNAAWHRAREDDLKEKVKKLQGVIDSLKIELSDAREARVAAEQAAEDATGTATGVAEADKGDEAVGERS